MVLSALFLLAAIAFGTGNRPRSHQTQPQGQGYYHWSIGEAPLQRVQEILKIIRHKAIWSDSCFLAECPGG